MFLAHSFRLRDPWQCEQLEGGSVRWSRVFHRPTGLEPDDALWLVASSLPAGATITVNGQSLIPLTSDAPRQFDVTYLLTDANRIEIETPPTQKRLADASPQPRFPYDVRLGIVAEG